MRLSASIHLIGGSVWGGMGLTPGPDCNMYLIECGGGDLAMVDCGSGLPASVKAVEAHVAWAGLDLARVKHILLTHAHGDHAGGAAAFAVRTGARIHASSFAAEALEAGDEEVTSIAAARTAGIFPADFKLEAVADVARVRCGDQVRIGSLTAKVHETPGHCAGHLSFEIAVDGATQLFAGDVVFWRGRALMQAISDCDPAALAASLAKLASIENLAGLFPGHGAFVLTGGSRHVAAAAADVRALRLPREL